MNIQTASLRNGTKVLGKNYKGQIVPVTYVNHTQAATRITDLLLAGIDARIYWPAGSRVIYVTIE